MDNATFRGDCARCAGLCCVALAFDRGPHFGFDKPAGEACANLDSVDRCAIHHRLTASGFGGCAQYDCSGAGQIVTAMFRGLGWRESQSTRRAMLGAFARVRDIQLLRLALRRRSAANQALERRFVTALASYANLLSLDLVTARRDVAALLTKTKELQ